MKIYLAGPMTGLPEFNYPAFHAAAKELRDAGHEVENPAESTLPEGSTWQEYMKDGISRLLHCDAIHLLPGWEASRGAMAEFIVAQAIGLEHHQTEELRPASPRQVWQWICPHCGESNLADSEPHGTADCATCWAKVRV